MRKNILWITNTIFPDLAKEIGENIPVGGGWMYGLANDLANSNKHNISLTVITSRPNIKDVYKTINGINYYLISGKKSVNQYDTHLESKWSPIINKVRPDVIHIHGTEYAVGLSLLKTRPSLNYVISIQGLISVYERYYRGGIPKKVITKNYTFKDFIKKSGIISGQIEFKKRGDLIEKKYIILTKHVIGRTQWDYNHVTTINPSLNYHFCNESLRDSFYKSKKWDIKSIKEHSIFLSQASYPIKGLHQVLKAISFISKDFPTLKVRVAGSNIIKSSNFRDKLKISGYGKYISELINSLNLQNVIEFTGPLNEQQMIKEYLDCHIFICPSSIENSPNSLGEAQLLGVPCIASYVGGVPDMISHGKDGLLYRFEETEMLSHSIKRIFENTELAKNLSENAIITASSRHDRVKNLKKLLSIYNDISS